MKSWIILVCILCLFNSVNAQTWQDTVSKINQLFNRYESENPGCQLSISRNDSLIYSKAWGIADIEHKVPLTTNSVIEAGSVSKQFTAASILLLEQLGKLSLNDDVRRYLPELQASKIPITIKDLLHHTSGLHDWTDIAEIAGLPRSIRNYSNEDILYMISNQKLLSFNPGSNYLYSNSNYILLAIIVGRVSGMSLADFTKKYLFEPSGMSRTLWRTSAKKIVPNRAIAYSLDKNGYKIDMPIEDSYGAGGLLTTTEDLLKWNNFYWSGQFGNPSLLTRQTVTGTLNDGSINSYGAGLFITKIKAGI